MEGDQELSLILWSTLQQLEQDTNLITGLQHRLISLLNHQHLRENKKKVKLSP
jgi:hypothetical protein